jgi:hypothetical protein
MARKPNTILIYEKIPSHLREPRKRAGLTQRDLADRLGNRNHGWRGARTANRRLDVAEWVEWCFGCRVDPKAALGDLIERRG